MHEAPIIRTDLTVMWNGWRIGEIVLDNPDRDRFGIGAQDWDFGALEEELADCDAGFHVATCDTCESLTDDLTIILDDGKTSDAQKIALIRDRFETA